MLWSPAAKESQERCLAFPYEVRDEKDDFDDIRDTKLGKDAMDFAKHIVQTNVGASTRKIRGPL